jgi:acetoin utilization deacetylase AcuC-like enzyme
VETFGEHFDVFEVTPATARTMQLFHSRDFVDALYKSRDACPREEFGLVDDCCAFRGVFELASLEAGGSVQAYLWTLVYAPFLYPRARLTLYSSAGGGAAELARV